eukprot:11478894-Heterocapsa_arctica.AAC.1
MKAAEDDIILKVAAPVVGALERRRRRVCWGLEVLPLTSGCHEAPVDVALGLDELVVDVVELAVLDGCSQALEGSSRALRSRQLRVMRAVVQLAVLTASGSRRAGRSGA